MEDKNPTTFQMLIGQKVVVSLLAGEVTIGGKVIAFRPGPPAFICVMDKSKMHFIPLSGIAEVTISNERFNEAIGEAK